MQKILIIEDNEELRENLTEILQLSGYEVVTAPNGVKGVATTFETTPDLILCDIMMPELDGYGVLAILSKDKRSAHIPFLFLTAKAELSDFRLGMTLGADDYITKPFEYEQLLRTISTRLEKQSRLHNATETADGAIEQQFNETNGLDLLRNLAINRELRQYKKKDVIYNEGDAPRWLYFIESGSAKVQRVNEDGREYIIDIATAGTFLGFTSLLQNTAYHESVAALENCTVRMVPKNEFLMLAYGNRDVNGCLLKLLLQTLSKQQTQLIDLAYDSVRRRVALALVKLSEQTGSRHLHILREDLAAMAATAKETLIRTLTDFKQESLILIAEGDIEIVRIDKLRNMPN